ncbi:hypothetical protein [uncultured Paraglaciecola sp.]|uniref:hypothetical protein n=1 Tax=uncultured Paraglaciecola sp. TaxID=1765024 RepID=UPI0030DDB4EC|tara:strand:+ start:284860 stop:285312 length:453 start_codon:yes stop_codon:yes gene_type:complete
MFLLGMIVFVFTTAMAMMMSGEIMMFVNVPSLIIVFPPALFLTFASTSKQSRSHALALLFSKGLGLNYGELSAAKLVFKNFGNLNLLMGWIGVVIGAIAMAANIELETFSQGFGPAFAVCMLTLFYALLMKVICYAAEAKIQFKMLNLTA